MQPARTYKRWAIDLLTEGVDIVSVAQQTGVPMRTLQRWQQNNVVAPDSKTRNPTPPPYARGYRWFTASWR